MPRIWASWSKADVAGSPKLGPFRCRVWKSIPRGQYLTLACRNRGSAFFMYSLAIADDPSRALTREGGYSCGKVFVPKCSATTICPPLSFCRLIDLTADATRAGESDLINATPGGGASWNSHQAETGASIIEGAGDCRA